MGEISMHLQDIPIHYPGRYYLVQPNCSGCALFQGDQGCPWEDLNSRQPGNQYGLRSIGVCRVGDGYPVLVIHGTMGGYDQGLLVAKPVIDAGFQVISVSRFGYLGSPLPGNATVDMQAEATPACWMNWVSSRRLFLLSREALPHPYGLLDATRKEPQD